MKRAVGKRPRIQVPRSKKTDEALRESEERFRHLVEGVKDYAILMLDPSGRILSWNPGAERIYGYAPEEILGKHISTFYSEEDVRKGNPDRELRVARAEGRFEEEGWRTRKDGMRFRAYLVVTPLFDEQGTLRGFSKVTRDVTERERAEEALGDLVGQLIKMQDEGRRRIAGELHDSTSPLLTTLIGKLYSARQRAAGLDAGISQLLDESLTLAESTVGTIRSISSLLHPRLLDEQGLVAGLRWYLEGFATRHGIHIETDLCEGLPRLPRDVEIALFRVAQESLTSIVQTGPGGTVRIRLVASQQILTLEVTNRAGKAFPGGRPRRTKAAASSDFGLEGMRQRIRQIGGRLDVDAGDAGILVRAVVPLGR